MTLQEYLSQNGITASAFGQQIGVPVRQTVSKYIRGDRFPPPEVLRRIREVTSGAVTADDFVRQHTASAVADNAAAPAEGRA